MLYRRVPTQISLAAFPAAEAAAVAAEKLATALKEEPIVCTDLICVAKNLDGKIHIREHGNDGPVDGFVAGGSQGTYYGACAGEIALSIFGEVGTTVGGVAGGFIGGTVGGVGGFVVGAVKGIAVKSKDENNHSLNLLADALEPGSSMLIACFDEVLVKMSDVNKKFKDFEQEELVAETATSIRNALKTKKILSMTALVGEEETTSVQTTFSKDALNMAVLLLMPERRAMPQGAKGKGLKEEKDSLTKLMLLRRTKQWKKSAASSASSQ